MSGYYYSKETGGFYTSMHATRPSDAKQISKQRWQELLQEQSAGKAISADENGHPIAVDPPAPSTAQVLESVKAQLRTQRAPMLDALTGIAGRAQRAGNTALAAEADALAEALLDITDDHDLNAAQTLEDMQAAGVAAYRAIASTASAELAVVFKEITGA